MTNTSATSAHRFCWVVWVCLGMAAAGWAGRPAAGQDKPKEPPKPDPAAQTLIHASGLLQQGLVKMAKESYESFFTKYARKAKPAQVSIARYGLAICHFHQKGHAEAISLLEKVRGEKNFKQSDEVLALLGHCYMAKGESAQALKAFDELLSKHKDSAQAEVAWLNRAQVLHMMGRHAEAIAACKAFAGKYPNSLLKTSADYTQALAQVALEKWSDAAATLGKVLRNPKSQVAFDAALLLGRCHEGMGKPDAAAKQYDSAVKIAPKERQSEAVYSLGVAQYAAGKYSEAIRALSRVLSDKTKSPYADAARFQLGLAQLADGKAGEARRTLTDVLKRDAKRKAKAQYWLAQCDMAEDKPEKYASARAMLDALARRKDKPPNLEAILYDRAICTMALQRHDEAGGEFAAFRKGYPKSTRLPDATYRQAFCLHKAGKYAESQALCERIASQPKLTVAPAAAELSAENLFLLAKYPEAAKAFEALGKAAKTEGQKLRLAFRLTQCAYLRGDYAGAIKLAEPLAGNRLVARDVNLRRAIFLLGDAYLQTGKHREAARALEKYMPLAAGDKDEARFKLGLAQLRAGDESSAQKTFEALLRGETKSKWVLRAMYEYAQLAYRKKQHAKAAPVLAKLLAANPPDGLAARALYLQAWIAFDAKKYPEAGKSFAELARRFPKHELADEAVYQQGTSLVEAGSTDKALVVLQAYVKDRSSGKYARQARHQLGRCLAKVGRHGEAAKVLSALAADKQAVSEDLLYELAWAQRESKDSAGAAASYERLLKDFGKGKLTTSARAELAELHYAGGKYPEAAKLLEGVVADKSAAAKTLSLAMYRLGWCYDKLGQSAKAASIFGTFAGKGADLEFAASAMYQAGMAYTKLGQLEQASRQFAALVGRFGKHDLAPVAQLKLGEIQAQLQDYAKSTETYGEFLKKHADGKFAFLAKFGMGWSLENRRKYDEARQWYEKVVATHNGPTAARAQFQIGECYFAEGKFEKAASELLKVEIVYAYPEWSARALYEAGRAFEAMKQPEQAKQRYTVCMTKYKDTPAAGQAARRLKAMKESK